MARQRDARSELRRPLERPEEVTERVGAARRPEADGGRDPGQQVIGGDEDAVLEQAELAVGVPWRCDELPAVEVLARLDEDGIALVADERAVERALPDELRGDVVGDAVQLEPVPDPLGPVRIPPHELALRVVERSLVHGRARQLVEIGCRADVVGVEVRDEDRRDLAARFVELRAPGVLRVGSADSGVDDDPAVVSRQQVRMHVAGTRWQRQGDPPDPGVELVHVPTLAAAHRIRQLADELTIRPYRQSDERGWVVCRVLSFLDSAFFDDVRQAKEHYEHPAIELVAERAGEIVGLIDVECEELPGTVCEDRPGLGGMIWHLAVHPDHQRQGVATELLQEAERLARERQLVRFEAWTRDDRGTQAWYESRGFERLSSYLHVYVDLNEGLRDRFPRRRGRPPAGEAVCALRR